MIEISQGHASNNVEQQCNKSISTRISSKLESKFVRMIRESCRECSSNINIRRIDSFGGANQKLCSLYLDQLS